ncbi:hypothetical protein [Kitasatospora sp. SUK 42]|uniref:hypothetical protein n=1 Tax=Kitasatospora sp. SUK 42 TaxID=1588882 RepID=UPI0018CB855E|nr:hypothetical protein [Kitasatospora sp. SUK 42]MBV2153016.1 hypothetical protein [Kitasatospora sp. SUK 42]
MTATTAHPVQQMKTPRAAAVVGIVFSVLLAAAIVLVRVVFPALPPGTEQWHASASGRQALRWALALLPFAGIAFLWFMGAMRAYVGAAEDKFVSTVFLGSGVLFVATLFALATTAGSLLELAEAQHGAPTPQLWQSGRHLTYTLLSSYCMRMAGVFTLSTTTIGRLLGLFPRRLVWLGYAVGLVLLFVVTTVRWSELVFPFWVLVVSCHILIAQRGTG